MVRYLGRWESTSRRPSCGTRRISHYRGRRRRLLKTIFRKKIFRISQRRLHRSLRQSGTILRRACGNNDRDRLARAHFPEYSGARIVPYASHRRADNSGWDVVLGPALEGFPSGDDHCRSLRNGFSVKYDGYASLLYAERLNAVLEAQIERSIEQYLWVHRRFKTRPPGMPPVYDVALLRRWRGKG